MTYFTPLWQYPSIDYKQLCEDYGTPLFVFSPDVLRDNIRQFKQALEKHYPHHQLAFSVKTNYLPYVLKKIIESGVSLEIISGLELDLVEKMGLIDQRTIVNGPLKTDDELARIVEYNCIINVDNISELKALEKLGQQKGQTFNIGLRICASIGDIYWKRFGFNAEDGEVDVVLKKVKQEMPHLNVVGFHIHLGTNLIDPDYFRQSATLVATLARQYSAEGLIDLQYLDLGGGFATEHPFKDKDPEKWQVPDIETYIRTIAEPIKAQFGNDFPRLILEPGRALIDSAMIVLTKVERMRGLAQNEAVVDVGINVFSSGKFRRHNFIRVDNETNQPVADNYTFYGPLCMRSDCLGEAVPLPPMRPGDILAIDYAGAYSITQSWRFIRFQPAFVAVENNQITLMRRREDIDYFMGLDLNY